MSEAEKEVLKTFKSGLGLTSVEQEILLNYIEKLQKENEEYHRIKKELIRVNKKIYDVDTIDELIETIDKLQKENQELKEENEKINKVADKMYEYISYYGWEDFESNTGCNREEMVDYFYKE